MYQYQAILLIGPTGSGKTPLGELFEQRGLRGRKCAHFDFGENLRRIAEKGTRPEFLQQQDMALIHDSLKTGALLEDEAFHIAWGILKGFVREREIDSGDVLVLNGLPRHPGQARDMEAAVDVKLIVNLECPAETVRQRIASDSGGDRVSRVDDSREEIEEKLRTFNERTVSLLDHYLARGVKIKRVQITVNTTPEEIHRALEEDHLF